MLISYLKRHRKIIEMLVLFAAVFAGVLSLYELPTEAILYSALLCAVIGGVLFAIGYLRYCSKHRRLRAMLGDSVAVSLDELPEPDGAVERDYQQLLLALRDEKFRVESRAQAAERNAGNYYALWAHQIKTPISAMRLLLQQEGKTDGAELAAELFEIERYVEMVLSYQRLGSEQTDYVLRSCELDGVVRACLRKYAKLFIAGKLPLVFEETGLTVLTDEKWLAFVIEQLLSNSLKYTRRGGIRISAVGRSLVIGDTGIGIRPEDLPRVFDKGFTGYNGREDKKSTGIGLYLCKLVCDRLGHGISIRSELGRGTEVTISFGSDDMLTE